LKEHQVIFSPTAKFERVRIFLFAPPSTDGKVMCSGFARLFYAHFMKQNQELNRAYRLAFKHNRNTMSSAFLALVNCGYCWLTASKSPKRLICIKDTIIACKSAECLDQVTHKSSGVNIPNRVAFTRIMLIVGFYHTVFSPGANITDPA